MIQDYEVNKIYTDEFGRISGVFPIDKPIGKTSHDMVYEYRKKLGTKKVGHAGALDPFASGLLIILAGKATKLSDQFLHLDKEYQAEILFGISTTTADPEGQIKQVIDNPSELKTLKETITNNTLQKALKEFQPAYNQHVPVFSSVKVNGEKLRKLARQYERFEVIENDNDKIVKFFNKDELKKELKLPKKEIKIYEIKLLELSTKNYEINIEENGIKSCLKIDFPLAKIKVKCSKGTYIRQLAEDIGGKFDSPAMLINLRRTQIGEIRLDS